MAIKPVELTINCGYARAAFREISVEQRKSGSERAECFTALFESTQVCSVEKPGGKAQYLKTFSTTGNYYHNS